MRTSAFAAVLACAAALAGCSSTTTSEASSDYQKLVADCKGRGGELKPIPGAMSPNEGANYACEFKGSGPTAPAGG